jgi:NAD-dependent DNA ligase
MTRKDAENEANNFGCFTGAAVSKNIDLVVAGKQPGEKVDQAKKLGIT